MNEYVGVWIHPDTLGREYEVGDWVMVESFDETIVIEISEVDDKGTLYWSGNRWVVPINQIVAVKQTAE